MGYFHITNTGKGFITHAENEAAHISGYPGDIWVTENTDWALRVGATEKSKEEAQALVNVAISGLVYEENHRLAGQQIIVTLP